MVDVYDIFSSFFQLKGQSNMMNIGTIVIHF